VATRVTGALATAETVSGIPKGQIGLRAIDQETVLQLAPDATESSLAGAKPAGVTPFCVREALLRSPEAQRPNITF
jgi:hypothetical protein